MVLKTISSETEYSSDRGVDIYGASYVAAACGVKFLSNLFCFVCQEVCKLQRRGVVGEGSWWEEVLVGFPKKSICDGVHFLSYRLSLTFELKTLV